MRRKMVQKLGLRTLVLLLLFLSVVNIFHSSSFVALDDGRGQEHSMSWQLSNGRYVESHIIRKTKKVEESSSPLKIRYVGVAGLGHRLIRMSSAYHLARILQVSPLDVFWRGYCPRRYRSKPNVFETLFGDEPLIVPTLENDLTDLFPFLGYNTSLSLQCRLFMDSSDCSIISGINATKNYELKLVNEVEGYTHLYSSSDLEGLTPPFFGKTRTDYEFYSQLIKRFRYKGQVDELLAPYKNTHTVIGIHVRAGNGETGDFEKFRQLGQGNLAGWMNNLTSLILDQITVDRTLVTNDKPPLVYLATDTEYVVDFFRKSLNKIPLLVTPQHYPTKGEGVSYNGFHSNLSTCLDSWKYQMMDMYVLSEYTDILIAGQYSSFTQSIPLSRILNDRNTRRRPRYFCDVHKSASAMKCYNSIHGMSNWLSTEPVGGKVIGRIDQESEENFAGPQLFFPLQLTVDSLHKMIGGVKNKKSKKIGVSK